MSLPAGCGGKAFDYLDDLGFKENKMQLRSSHLVFTEDGKQKLQVGPILVGCDLRRLDFPTISMHLEPAAVGSAQPCQPFNQRVSLLLHPKEGATTRHKVS